MANRIDNGVVTLPYSARPVGTSRILIYTLEYKSVYTVMLVFSKILQREASILTTCNLRDYFCVLGLQTML